MNAAPGSFYPQFPDFVDKDLPKNLSQINLKFAERHEWFNLE
jgi:hypothetical protein